MAVKRESKYPEYFREKPLGERLYRRDTEPVLELCTDYEHDMMSHIGYAGIRPLQRKSICIMNLL